MEFSLTILLQSHASLSFWLASQLLQAWRQPAELLRLTRARSGVIRRV
jgi:hypothetical protein